MILYSYWRSSTSYRTRIALNLKGLPFETVPVDLVAGDQKKDTFRHLNPSQAVPALMTDDGVVLTQSMAIIDWLEDCHPTPPLQPTDRTQRALVRAAAQSIACDIHPINNLRVLAKLRTLGQSAPDIQNWMRDWMVEGLSAFQALISESDPYCFGSTPTLADVCLIPQLYNARRWGVPTAPFTRLFEIEAACLALSAFDQARPELQSDAPH